jgi:hypothetical protein
LKLLFFALALCTCSCKVLDSDSGSSQVKTDASHDLCNVSPQQKQIKILPIKTDYTSREIAAHSTLNQIYTAGLFSYLAYSSGSEIEKVSKKWGFDRVDTIEKNGMFAAVVSNDSCVYLTFRGTDLETSEDILVDIDISKRRVPSGKIHRGFYKAYTKIHKKLVAILGAHDAKNKQFVVTGHSLGGGLAGVFAYYNSIDLFLNYRSFDIDKVITFGQPRFSDTLLSLNMQREFKERYIRIVNNIDIITRIPPGYSHFGALYWLNQNKLEIFKPRLSMRGSNGTTGGGELLPPEEPVALAGSEESYKQFKAMYAQNPDVYTGPSIGDHRLFQYLGKLGYVLDNFYEE